MSLSFTAKDANIPKVEAKPEAEFHSDPIPF